MCIVRHLPPASNYFIKAAALSLAWNGILWNDVDMEIPTFIKTRPSILGESQIFRLWSLKNIHPWNLFTSEIYSPLKFIHPEKYSPVKKYFSLKNIHSWKIFPPEKYSYLKTSRLEKYSPMKNILNQLLKIFPPEKMFTPETYSTLKNIRPWRYSAPIMHKILFLSLSLSLSLSSQEDSQFNILNPWTSCFW